VHAERPNAPLRRLAQPGSRDIYLTFDDGPDEEWTARVLDVLEACSARATFFVIGRAARESSALVRRIVAAGHEIGNHGYSHRHPWTMSARNARTEVRNGGDAIAQSTGVAPRLFRPAYGRLRRAMAAEATQSGQRIVLWSRSAIDWGPFAQPDRVAARISAADAGDIVLMHDGRNQSNHPKVTVEVLPAVLRQFADRRLSTALLPSAKH
jgi:peptidoglycan-N-acetylglucosamine deacetylase